MSKKLEAIRDRWNAATPGPWAWHGNERIHNVYLTQEYGETVMAMRRWGMQNAQPVFTVNHFLKPASEFMQVDHNGFIWSIHHPDAVAIASAPSDIAFLIGQVDRLNNIVKAVSVWDARNGGQLVNDPEIREALTENAYVVPTDTSGYWLDNVAVTDPPSPFCRGCGRPDDLPCICPPDDAQYMRAWRDGAFDDELEGFAEADFYTVAERVMSGE